MTASPLCNGCSRTNTSVRLRPCGHQPGKKRNEACEERDTEAMMQKLLRPFELALLAVIGAVEWVIGWVERQSTPMKLGLGMLLGVAATMTVAAIYAGLR
jgi:hypothetical protein